MSADRRYRPSRFFPNARARYRTLYEDIIDQKSIIKTLPTGYRATANQTLQQYEEVRDWLSRPHFLRGPKWSGNGIGLNFQETESLWDLGWSSKDINSDEEDFLQENEIAVWRCDCPQSAHLGF